MIEEHASKDEFFTDNHFPAAKYSLITDWDEDHDEVREARDDDKWGDIEWKRAWDIQELNDEEEGSL